jgi:small subunit ribosomal protein S2e
MASKEGKDKPQAGHGAEKPAHGAEKPADSKAGAGAGGDKKRGFGRDKKKGDKDPRKRGPVEEEWTPVTKLGRLVNQGLIKSVEEIYTFSIPIKESQIVDKLFGKDLKEEVMKIMPVQKQTQAG